FKEIEEQSGFLKQLEKGVIQQKIAETAEKEQQLFDSGTITLVGINRFEHKDEIMKDQLELYPFLKKNPRKTLFPPIIPRRLAEKVEQERLDNE
ncbi:MAG: methylmalonyl-CoA mutase, partial [Flavobacteriaceae bacterium]|nr:methylmalonyl-CoA mutase [Flavobacteriaceae bacterium]